MLAMWLREVNLSTSRCKPLIVLVFVTFSISKPVKPYLLASGSQSGVACSVETIGSD